MIQTIKFRLFPTNSQVRMLDEIFVIYNRLKRRGYNLLINKEEEIQQKLMYYCQNNPYVNSILIENQTRLEQQNAWGKKKNQYLKYKINVINEKKEQIRQKDAKDRRLRGLYSRLSSLQNKLMVVKNSPIVFGGKQLFRERILNNINRQEFKMRRDASFSCVGKKQGVNLNLKILHTKELKVRTFSKIKEKKWLVIPFSVNEKQEEQFQGLLKAEKYTATVKRKIIKHELRYYVHFSFNIPKPEKKYSFENGAVGLDFNYNFVALANIDRNGELLSYQNISFRNLHSYPHNKRENYISFKLDKIINYCINKKKGLIFENLSFNQSFSYNKSLNRKLSNFKTSALELLKRKCIKKGVDFREVHPAYTSLIGKYKYSRLHNLSVHILASYVIARRGLGLEEELPAIYERLLSQVGDIVKPHLKKSSPYYEWSRIHDLFKCCGITSFKTSEIMRNVLNFVRNAQSDNLKTGLSSNGEIDKNNNILQFYKIDQDFINF